MQTTTKLYLVLDFINGGHLFYNLYRQVRSSSEAHVCAPFAAHVKVHQDCGLWHPMSLLCLERVAVASCCISGALSAWSQLQLLMAVADDLEGQWMHMSRMLNVAIDLTQMKSDHDNLGF